jgi:hypothetical protein
MIIKKQIKLKIYIWPANIITNIYNMVENDIRL